MKSNGLIEAFEEISPGYMAEKWDNCGLLAGSKEKEVKTVYIALDATDGVIRAAVENKSDMLITHHPLIFSGLKSVTDTDFIQRRIIKLIKNDITYYAMHTNFDVAVMGELAADYIGLKDRKILEVTLENGGMNQGFGRIGMLAEKMTIKELCDIVKEAFGLKFVKLFGDLNKSVEKAAVMPGSGKSTIDTAVSKGAEVIITGDIDHHDGIDAVAKGIQVIDAGHYGIEHIFVNYMKEYINNKFPDINVLCEENKNPFIII